MTSPSIASVAQGIWNAPIDFSAIRSSIGSVSFSGAVVTILVVGAISNIAKTALPFYNQQLEDAKRDFATCMNISKNISNQIVQTAVIVSAIALTAYFGLLPSAFALQAIQYFSIDLTYNLGAHLIQQVADKVFNDPNVSALVSNVASILLVAKGALSFKLAPASLVLGLAKIKISVGLFFFFISQLPTPQERRDDSTHPFSLAQFGR